MMPKSFIIDAGVLLLSILLIYIRGSIKPAGSGFEKELHYGYKDENIKLKVKQRLRHESTGESIIAIPAGSSIGRGTLRWQIA
ncbi:MAG: hypothetical protein WKI04_14580 [Ferruginibacter sp.]